MRLPSLNIARLHSITTTDWRPFLFDETDCHRNENRGVYLRENTVSTNDRQPQVIKHNAPTQAQRQRQASGDTVPSAGQRTATKINVVLPAGWGTRGLATAGVSYTAIARPIRMTPRISKGTATQRTTPQTCRWIAAGSSPESWRRFGY